MDQSGKQRGAANTQGVSPCAVLWLGEHSDLLQRVWPLAEIYHVASAEALLRALDRRLAPCVLLDFALTGVDFPRLIAAITTRWPGVILLALAPPAAADLPTPAGLRALLRRDIPPAELLERLRTAYRESTALAPAPESHTTPSGPREVLEERMRHLEGLVQATFNLSNISDKADILGDLRKAALVAVDASDMAILLADDDLNDLTDTLELGVPGRFREVCVDYLRALPAGERLAYLGDEILLRARTSPNGQAPSQRVREAEAAGASSYMRLPLLIEGRLTGFVALFSNIPEQFNGAHLQLGRLFAAQVATAVRNMHLFYRLNDAEQRRDAVSRVARLIAEDLALETVLTRIVEEAVRLVKGHSGAVALVEEDGSAVFRATSGQTSHTRGERIPPGAGQAGMIAISGQPSMITQYPEWERALPGMRQDFAPDSVLLGVPLIYRNHVLGVLQVIAEGLSTADAQTALDLLMMLAPQAATAVAKAQLHEIVRQERQQLQAILDHTSAAVAVCDAEGRLLLLNPVVRRVLERLDLPAPQVMNQRLPDLLHQWLPDQPLAMPDLHTPVEINLGELGEYLVTIAPITRADGTIERYVGVAQEVSELRRLDRMKSDLIHILSHDLRNPLGLARGSLDLLDEPDLPREQRAQLKEMIVTSLERMEQLIKDVVDLEMAESLGFETAVPYLLPALVQKVVKRNQGKAESQGVALHYQEIQAPTDRLQGHAVLVAQAIENLVSNAIKYTQSGGRVDVRLMVEGAYAVVQVQDTGYGIPAESLPLLFRQFYRVPDRRTRHIQGTGLGLSLVKTIALAHGGRVSVRSEIDQGSTFSFYLPLELPEPQAPSSSTTRLDLSGLVKSLPAR